MITRTVRCGAVVSCALAVLVVCVAGAPAPKVGKLQFNRDVRPILSENCFACHGPDSASRKADLRLDKREVAVDMGAIVPGDLENSELCARITSDDDTQLMPPPKSGKKLKPEQKEILQRWIKEGAEYELHWSLIAPARPPVPKVKNEAWARNPVDAFILAKLEEHHLEPAPEADRRTLARRLALDLTGLPPDPADVEAFVNDPDENAYEKLVDKFMSTPQWGEHRGRYWLDAARYADTHGIHFDNFREMWAYRDWVINAFNRNLPFDQFTIEQLAGDLLPNHTLDQMVASGFNRCNITTNEGGIIDEEYLVLYDRDRTETFGQVFLGHTVGCAVCHDHKFDPLPQKEFYELAAFFNNTTQGARDGNIKDTPPTVFVPPQSERERWFALEKELVAARADVDARKSAARAEFDQWLVKAKPEPIVARIPTKDQRLHAWLLDREAPSENSTEPLLESADAGNFEKDQSFSYAAWIKILKGKPTGSVVARMDEGNDHRGWDLWIEGGKVATHLIHKWPDNALKVAAEMQPLKPGEWTHLLVTYDGSAKPEGVKIYINGKAQPTSTAVNGLKDTIRTEVPLKVGERSNGGRLANTLFHDLRLYGRTLSAKEAEELAGASYAADIITKPVGKRTQKETEGLFTWWLETIDTASQGLVKHLAALEGEQAGIKSRGTVAHVMTERAEPPIAYVLYRGEYDKRRDKVNAKTPSALPPMPKELPVNRLGLAQWLLRPEHPLTARVTVNRFWQEVFGTGIVRTSGDFGVTGEAPSHPELLDWMAVEFREQGWDVKRFFKMLVTSSTYRQAAVLTSDKLEEDSQNRLLSRGPRFRMDAEEVRDYALAASGLLVKKIGGPSVRPYQPDGVWEAVAMPESNTRYYKRDSGDSLYRRSMYTFWKRAAPPATMDVFNAPSRETCTVRRERTNTPLQALVTMNDPQFVESARHLAQLALEKGGDSTASRLDFIAGRLLARPFRPEETKVVRGSLEALLADYKTHPEDAKKLLAVGESKADASLDPPTLAAWTMLCNELLNLDEVLNK